MNTAALPGLARLVLARLRHGRPILLDARILARISAWLAPAIRSDLAPPPGR